MKITYSTILFLLLFATPCDAAQLIREIPPQGIIIDAPGSYLFANDIVWRPTTTGQAVLIVADGVTLDLQHYTLQNESPLLKTVGIYAKGASDLVIKNGTIAGMGVGGVWCKNGTGVIVKEIIVDGLAYSDIVNYTVPAGILAASCNRVLVKKCKVKNADVTTGSLAGIQMSETVSSQVLECEVSSFINRDGACTGIGHFLSDDSFIKSCKIRNLTSTFQGNLNTEGHTAIGMVPTLSANVVIEKCSIANIFGCCDDAHGISAFECLGIVIQKCSVCNVVDGNGPEQTGAKATGIEVYSSGAKVSDCWVKNIVAINPQDKQSTGFSMASGLGIEFVNCKAENVSVVDANGNTDSSLGFGTGFGWAPDPRPEFALPVVGSLHKNCTAKNCQVGFDTWFSIDGVWDNIKAEECDIGVFNQQSASRTISCNPCSECGCHFEGCYPTPRTVTLDNVAANNVFKNVKLRECAVDFFEE